MNTYYYSKNPSKETKLCDRQLIPYELFYLSDNTYKYKLLVKELSPKNDLILSANAAEAETQKSRNGLRSAFEGLTVESNEIPCPLEITFEERESLLDGNFISLSRRHNIHISEEREVTVFCINEYGFRTYLICGIGHVYDEGFDIYLPKYVESQLHQQRKNMKDKKKVVSGKSNETATITIFHSHGQSTFYNNVVSFCVDHGDIKVFFIDSNGEEMVAFYRDSIVEGYEYSKSLLKRT